MFLQSGAMSDQRTGEPEGLRQMAEPRQLRAQIYTLLDRLHALPNAPAGSVQDVYQTLFQPPSTHPHPRESPLPSSGFMLFYDHPEGSYRKVPQDTVDRAAGERSSFAFILPHPRQRSRSVQGVVAMKTSRLVLLAALLSALFALPAFAQEECPPADPDCPGPVAQDAGDPLTAPQSVP
jgi:hypothetical protein